MTPDGALWVNIHAISHTNRGLDSRGKWLKDRWNLWYMLTKSDQQIEYCTTVYWESQQPFRDAGWDFSWPYGERMELNPPIPVIIDVVKGKYQVIEVEKRKVEAPNLDDPEYTAWRDNALPRARQQP